MKVTKIELNSQGVRDLLTSDEITKECERYGNEALGRLRDIGYESDTYHGVNRTVVMVKATKTHAIRDNAKNNSILKAVFSK